VPAGLAAALGVLRRPQTVSSRRPHTAGWPEVYAFVTLTETPD
jgi:hypothetical protein